MGILTDTWEVKLLEHIFGRAKLDIPGNLYLGLHSGTPTEASPSTGEVSGSGYSRVHIVDNQHGATTSSSSNMFTKFGFGTNDSLTNESAIDFGEATGSWGAIGHYSIWDDYSSTGVGNCLMIGALSSEISVGSGDQFRIAAGEFNITFPAKMGMGGTAFSTEADSTSTDAFQYWPATEWRRQVARRLGFINEPWGRYYSSFHGNNSGGVSRYDWQDQNGVAGDASFNKAINNRNSYWPSVSLAYPTDTFTAQSVQASLGDTAYDVIANSLYLGLYSNDPGSHPLNVTSEIVGGGGYARQQLIFNDTGSNILTVMGFATTNSGVTSISNSSVIAFPEATSDWGSITHWGIYRGFHSNVYSNSGGTYRVSDHYPGSAVGYGPMRYPFLTGALTTPRTVNSGDVLRFGIGDFVIKLD